LRQANLPHRENSQSGASSPAPLPSSPPKSNGFPQSVRAASPVRGHGNGSISPTYGSAKTTSEPILRPNRSYNQPNLAQHDTPDYTPAFEDEEEREESKDTVPRFPSTPSRPPPLSPSYTGPANSGRGIGGLPRTVPLSPTRSSHQSHGTSKSVDIPKFNVATLGRSNSSVSASALEKLSRPMAQTSTGTRYGVALTGTATGNGGSPVRQWGSGTPSCPRCEKSVYFAEQVLCTLFVDVINPTDLDVDDR